MVGIDLGGGARHRRGARVAAGLAPLRETMAAQLILLSRWDARTEPLVDPMAGGATIPIEAAGLAAGAAIRRPSDLPFRHLAAFEGLPDEAPDLFPGTIAQTLALDIDPERIPAMVGNLRAAGLTGAAYERSIVIAQRDVRGLTPEDVERLLPASIRRTACASARSTATKRYLRSMPAWDARWRASGAGAQPVLSRTRASCEPSATCRS